LKISYRSKGQIQMMIFYMSTCTKATFITIKHQRQQSILPRQVA